MESTRFLQKFTHHVHYDKPSNSLPLLTIAIPFIILISNLFMVVLYEQNNTEKRLKAVAEIYIVTCCLTCIILRAFRPEEATQKIIDMIGGELLEDCRILFVSDRKRRWGKIYSNYEKKRKDMDRLYQNIKTATSGLYFAYIGRNAFNQLFEEKSNSEKSWPTLYNYWCPPGYDSFYVFLMLEMLHIYVFSFSLSEAFCFMLSTCLATERVLADFETIYLLIDEMSENFGERNFDLSAEKRLDLRNYMALLVQCHQKLNRNFKYCADYTAFGTLAITFPISVDTVISIYTMMKASNVKIMANYAVACVFVNLIILFCYHNGQKIVNQNDILRQYLREVPWIDKPQWFKSSLCIMMRRANIDTEMKPYGLFVLNHESFKNIIKAAFSYGNIIYSVKSSD
ncbi:uncharacterized protein LOC120349851 isoform X2 [Nilaparvata lugens]|uniref:uncharacterized protein LOC120349851 isoform X2 n=1 Tax=Nilaparvata lugens TaxID=108931 RepID=UPI00193E5CC4|nr:uncharacterized protein LOC120349851 isoform X2 [Nilaparvata lugens]XP_039276948.1 uncharacterized protein LOC120349851 isoform X2 [Nilaparvata lugens]